MTWRAIAGSVAGTSHHKRGVPGQDFSLLDLVGHEGEILIAVAADGAGSATHGEQGAILVCRQLLHYARWWAKWHDNRLEMLDTHVVARWLAWTRRELEIESYQLGVGLRALACTVLGIVADATRAVCFQIGDGAIVLQTATRPLHVVFWPKVGEYANMTCFLTDAAFDHNQQIAVIEDEPVEVALLTDGLQRLALQFAAQSVHAPFFTPMFERLAAEPQGRALTLQQQLLSFLDSPSVNERTDDDKTLILATRSTRLTIRNLPIDP